MAVTKLVITNKLRNDIIERRKENALSSYELSEQSGHSKFWLQNIESGKTKKISKDDLLSIYRVLFQADSDDEIMDDVEQILNQPIGSTPKDWYELINISSDFENIYDEDELMETLEEDLLHNISELIRNKVFGLSTNQKQAALTAVQNFYYSLYLNPELTFALINIPIYGVNTSNSNEYNDTISELFSIAAKYNDLAIKNNSMKTIKHWQEMDKYYETVDKQNIQTALANFKKYIQKILNIRKTENPDMFNLLNNFLSDVTFMIERGQPNVTKHYLKSFLHIYTGEQFSMHIKDCVKWFIGFQRDYDLPYIYDVIDKKDLEAVYSYLDAFGDIKRPIIQ
ncbi:hypothetical protein H6B11_10900 [Mediterraneibacter glycyrrhizinilyticus]|nr:hypothetical protein [Mediterraneibacter glycyrrhizinilyticus]MBM6854659.1 hypothetical protein [Mediterraneibacter glycyrrhizinilyticus]